MMGEILVPGCGFGHDVRAIASASLKALVVGLDIAPAALIQAKRYPLTGNERYICGDLFGLPSELTDRFDWVVEHTCFCTVLPQQRRDYVRAVSTALRESGRLLAIFFLNPWDPEEVPAEGGPPFGVSVDELNELFLSEFQLEAEERPTVSYPGREGREIVWLLRKR